jgi:hypothetical protein
MAKLGSAQTKKFSIGTAEVRVGPLASAGRVTQANSIGLVDSATVEVTQTSVDLKGGFPQQIQDTAVTEQATTMSATLREMSRRNLKILLGEGLDAGAAPVDVASLVVTAVLVDGTSFDVTASEGANFAVGDTVVIYPDGQPENVSVDKITGIATDTITVANGLAVAVDGTADTIHIYVANQIAIGAVTQTNYFSVSLVQAENSTGRPVGFNFWKAALGGSMTFATNATDFASNDLSLKILQPASSEFGAGQPLVHLADVIPNNPTGMYMGGGDA